MNTCSGADGVAAATFFVPTRGIPMVRSNVSAMPGVDKHRLVSLEVFIEHGYYEFARPDADDHRFTRGNLDAEECLEAFLNAVAQYVARLQRR